MGELVIATLFWEANRKSKDFSRCYSEEWVEKLFRGFARNLTMPLRFVCFTDRPRHFAEPIEQIVQPDLGQGGYGDCIRPYVLGKPMILVGLDTVVTGNCDELAKYCLTAKRPAYPLDPYNPKQVCNGVGLVPAGHERIFDRHGGQNDMEWVRRFPHDVIDERFPGQVQSYKGHVEKHGLGDTRICFFHGKRKTHELPHVGWIKEHWR